MADVQLENGYCSVANDIITALARQVISPDEWRVLMVVIRKTYGWNKKSDMIALSQFADATGMKRQHVCRALKKLIARNIVTCVGNAYCNEYSVQKDYDRWQVLPKQVTVLPKQVTSLPEQVIGVTQTGNEVLPKQVTTKDTITKDTNTKDRESVRAQRAPRARKPVESDDEWLTRLQSEYPYLDVAALHRRMHQWCERKRETPSRRRLEMWLKKEKPIAPPAPQKDTIDIMLEELNAASAAKVS
jgi:phage replication O-like protein O